MDSRSRRLVLFARLAPLLAWLAFAGGVGARGIFGRLIKGLKEDIKTIGKTVKKGVEETGGTVEKELHETTGLKVALTPFTRNKKRLAGALRYLCRKAPDDESRERLKAAVGMLWNEAAGAAGDDSALYAALERFEKRVRPIYPKHLKSIEKALSDLETSLFYLLAHAQEEEGFDFHSEFGVPAVEGDAEETSEEEVVTEQEESTEAQESFTESEGSAPEEDEVAETAGEGGAAAVDELISRYRELAKRYSGRLRGQAYFKVTAISFPTATFDIVSPETMDTLASSIPCNRIHRLPAGIYHLKVSLGDGVSVMLYNVVVEPGKLGARLLAPAGEVEITTSDPQTRWRVEDRYGYAVTSGEGGKRLRLPAGDYLLKTEDSGECRELHIEAGGEQRLEL